MGGSPRAPLGLPSTTQPHLTYQIRRLLAVAAAAARARVTGTLIKKGAEGPPPLPSSPGSQIFVVGGGASELVVLVVVSGEHGGNSGPGRGCSPRGTGGFMKHTVPAPCVRQVLPPPSDSPCFLSQTCPASPTRQILLPHGSQMTLPPDGPYQECPDSKDQDQDQLW